VCRRPAGVRTVGEVAEAEGGQPPVQVPEEADEAAAIHRDGVPDFVPERPIEMTGRDAEFTADVGDDGADRPAPNRGGDFIFRGQARETRVLGVVAWLGFGLGVRGRDCGAERGPRAAGRRMGVGVRSRPRAARRMSAASRTAARRRPLVMRARMTARSAVPKGLARRAKPGVAARCWTVAARCVPKSMSLRTRQRTRPRRPGLSVVARSGAEVGVGSWAAADMNEAGTQTRRLGQGKSSCANNARGSCKG